jgi:hypothetical protein
MGNRKLGKYSSMTESYYLAFFAVFQFIVAAHYVICEYFTTGPKTRGAPGDFSHLVIWPVRPRMDGLKRVEPLPIEAELLLAGLMCSPR